MQEEKKMSKIGKLRIKRGLTVTELAKKMKVTHTAVLKWDKGSGYPRARLLPKLAKVLNCSVTDFF